MTRKICFVTGSRAEFGLLRTLMLRVASDPNLTAQIVATGSHLSAEHGSTITEIEAAGLCIDERVEMLLESSSPVGVTKSMGRELIGLADAYARLSPDLIVLLGDRFEMLAAASAALIAGIPVAHINGGEITEGAFDDAIRHAITKLSHLHFPAAEEYARRIVQLGENPERVFLVGGLGVDAINNLELLDRAALERALDFELSERSLLVTFHPETLAVAGSEGQVQELLGALGQLDTTSLIFTMPNADNGGDDVRRQICEFIDLHANARGYASLGQLRYLSCMKHVDAVVGNSSSGLAEAPSLKTGTINIGDRQKGRLRATSVIDCGPDRHEILEAVRRLYSPEFRSTLASTRNPYGDGGAAERIFNVIATYPLDDLRRKAFWDLPR